MVEVIHWNPRRNRIPVLRRYRVGPRVGNFGDLIGPLVVAAIRRREAIGAGGDGRRLLAVGSILHLARDGDVIWGTGVNGKIAVSQHRFTTLDVRAVRGPLTRAWLRDEKGIDAPAVYGDPALLLKLVRPDLFADDPGPRRPLTIVPNLNDHARMSAHAATIDPRRPVHEVVRAIRASEVVVASSLHGILVAELAGVPVVPLASRGDGPLGPEPLFKYEDYFSGTGRPLPEFAPDLETAIEQAAAAPAPDLHVAPIADRLMAAFPRDVWRSA
ncbi:polysaccharide pyruvyl transferase family protein [Microbacterium sp. NPDC058389]|uniref:polysaccharide pyruvyl transferase family protein n=1 Tax=Microbacterium sp. NPDC058389 TaxID=3346475 RepID=UPI003653F009